MKSLSSMESALFLKVFQARSTEEKQAMNPFLLRGVLPVAMAALALVACGGGEREADSIAVGKAPAVSQAPSATASFNYAEALQKSILFYEAQQSGKLPAWNRVSWRGDSRLNDGSDVGLDLSGGWYDAGDHVKFGFPMAGTATQLAWGALEFEAGHKNASQHEALLRNLRFVNDYFIKAHPSANVFYGQVGNGNIDHGWWGPSEVYPRAAPAYKIDSSCGGSELAAETAAAMAAASMVFKASDAAYSATLLTHARQLYNLADTKRQKYVECITDAQSFYNSWSGYNDELAWGAVWLYRATGEQAFLDKAESFVNTTAAGFGAEGQSGQLPYKWTHDWDSKHYGTYLLLSRLTGKAKYSEAIERNLAYWTTGTPQGERVTYTPGGLAWLSQWGSLRYAMNESFLAMVYSKDVADAAKKQAYRDFAMRQLNYALGQNPRNSSYLIGFGTNPPQSPHHRTAHGSYADSQTVPAQHRHVLYGALVGGPNASDAYTDSISDFISNEVATDYNASFTGVLAAAQQLFPGGAPLANFPPPTAPSEDEFFVEAGINGSGATYTEIKALVNNRSGWPARSSDKLAFRYFVDLTEVFAAGRTAADITVSMNFSQGGMVRPLARCGTSNIFYATGDFTGTAIFPGGQSSYRKEMQMRIAAPAGTTFWSPANDPSFAGLPASGVVKNTAIALYDNGKKVFGTEPAACGGTPIPLPAVPTGLQATGGAGSIALTWSAASNAVGYNVKRSASGAAGSFTLVGSPTAASFTDTGLAASTTYYYVVSARNDGGESANSSTASATTNAGPPPVLPGAPSVTATAGDARITLNWAAASNAAGYTVQRSASAGGTFANIVTLGATARNHVDSGLTNGTAYFYRVLATNAAGSTASSVVTATPVGSGGGGGGTGACTLTLDTSNSWANGQVLRVTLANTGATPITNWSIAFTESASFTLGNAWNGTFSVTGNQVTVTPAAWNGTIAPNSSVDAGMQINFSGAKPTPSAASVAGRSCTVVIR
jgi:endoglucanase